MSLIEHDPHQSADRPWPVGDHNDTPGRARRSRQALRLLRASLKGDRVKHWVALACAGTAAYYCGTGAADQAFTDYPRAQALLYGWGSTAAIGLIGGYAFVWPTIAEAAEKFVFGPIRRVKAVFGKPGAARSTATPSGMRMLARAVTGGDVINNPFAVITYAGRVNRDLHFQENGRVRRKRFRTTFKLSRTMAAMPPREREAAKILQVLNDSGNIPRDIADWCCFALCWGDGRGNSSGPRFTFNGSALIQNNMTTLTGVIAAEAQFRGANCEAAIGALLTWLHRAAMKRNASEIIKTLYQRIAHPGGDQWE